MYYINIHIYCQHVMLYYKEYKKASTEDIARRASNRKQMCFFVENPYLKDFLAKGCIYDQQFIQNIINLDTVNLAKGTIKKYFSNIEFKKMKNIKDGRKY